jgi:PAS domain S-box-containing protein
MNDEHPDTIPMPADEFERLDALDEYEIVGPEAEEAFDRVASLASKVFEVPIAMVNIIDEDTQWTKSCVGLDVSSVERDQSICTHTIVEQTVVDIPDLRDDPRFEDNRFVTGEPHLRSYAGAPISTPDGHVLGAVCIIDYEAREPLDDDQKAILSDLAQLAFDEMELRRETRLHQEEVARREAVAEELRLNTERLETAMDAASMGVWEWDTQTDMIELQSDLPSRYGFDPGQREQPLSQLLDVIEPEFRDDVLAQFEQAREAPRMPPLRFRIQQAEDRATWIEISGRRRESGSPIFVGAVRDVSVEQHRLQQLEESKANFQRMLENVPFAVFAVLDDKIIYANDAALELLGITRDDIPADVSEFVHPDSADKVASRLESVRSNRLGDSLEVTENQVCTAQDELRFVKSTAFGALFGDEEVVISVMRDITEEKKLLARMMQMDRVAAIGTLSAGVGHEINNPLSYIRGNLDYVIRWLENAYDSRDDAPDGSNDVIDAMREAREGTERIREITRDLRRLSSRPDQEFETYPTNVNAVLDSAVKLAHHELKRRAQVETDYAVIPDAIAEPSSLGQAFLNILLNSASAFDSMPDSDDNVVRVATREAEDLLVVEIEDNGCGIPEDTLDNVFDAFFTTRSTGQGTGLGLTTAQASVEKMDGFIEIESTEGEGTLVRVSLPKAHDHATIETSPMGGG